MCNSLIFCTHEGAKKYTKYSPEVYQTGEAMWCVPCDSHPAGAEIGPFGGGVKKGPFWAYPEKGPFLAFS